MNRYIIYLNFGGSKQLMLGGLKNTMKMLNLFNLMDSYSGKFASWLKRWVGSLCHLLAIIIHFFDCGSLKNLEVLCFFNWNCFS